MDENRKAILQARQKQIDKITKGFDNTDEADNLEKAVYVDNPENRRLNRVGQTYGGKKADDKPAAVKYYPEVEEDFVDEDTGDVVKVKTQRITDEGRKALEGVVNEVKSKHIKAIETQIGVTNKLYSKWSNLEGELADLKTSVDEMGEDRLRAETDMEEEYGKTPADLQDKVSNEYGDKFNEIDDEMQELLDEIKKVEPLVEEAHEKLNEAQRVQRGMIDKMKKEQARAVKAFESKHGYKSPQGHSGGRGLFRR